MSRRACGETWVDQSRVVEIWFAEPHRDVRQTVQRFMNLSPANGSDRGAADHDVAPFACDFDRLAEVRAQCVERGRYLQFFVETDRFAVRGFNAGFNSECRGTRRHTRLARHAAGGSSYSACGNIELV